MKPSIWSDYFEHLAPEDAVLSFIEGGFSCGELGIDHSRILQARNRNVEKTGLAFAAFLADNGFTFPQGHLDFEVDLCAPDAVEQLKKEITLFQAVGVRNAVIHINGGMDLPEKKQLETQANHLRALLEFVEGADFTICIENLRPNPTVADADKILQWIDLLGGKNLGICLDTGHLNVSRISKKTTEQTHGEFIRKAGKHLKALHINGNDGTDDYHLAPFCIKNSVDWREVITALREVGFDGPFNLEVPGEVKDDPPMYVMKRKLQYLKELTDYMLSDDFPE